jgi:DnaA family protein
MTQLTLILDLPLSPTLDNFTVGDNGSLLHALRQLSHYVSQCVHQSATPKDPLSADKRCIYLWGQEGVGKSHILEALATHANTSYLHPKHIFWDDKTTLYCVDEIDLMNPHQQKTLFNLYNHVRERPHKALVMAGRQPPSLMQVREDLRTRLGWGLVYQVQPLNDEARQHALFAMATQRGLVLPDKLARFILQRFARDMRSLKQLIHELDLYSLQQKKPLSIHLMREWMRLKFNPKVSVATAE